MEINKKLEIGLKKIGFKKKYLDDKSGYWFERKYDIPVFGKITVLVDDIGNKINLIFEVKSNYKVFSGHDQTYAGVDFKVKNITDIKKILKKFKLIK